MPQSMSDRVICIKRPSTLLLWCCIQGKRRKGKMSLGEKEAEFLDALRVRCWLLRQLKQSVTSGDAILYAVEVLHCLPDS